MEFNDAQKTALSHRDGPMMVLAGPGSGKTTVITHRIKRLLEQGVSPSGILVITFTKAAAREMKERFFSLMKQEGENSERVSEAEAVSFGTFHAVFYHILRLAYGFSGNNIISEEDKKKYFKDFIEASGLELGDNLLTVSRATVGGNVKAALPYVDQVSVGRVLPDTVVISVKESQLAFVAATDTNTVWLISPSGKALERIDASLQEQYPQIIGVTLNNPTAGQTVTAVNQSALDAVLSLFSELDGTGILEHTASVNVEKEYDMVLQYDDRYEIDLGSTDRLDYKVQYLQAILKELSDFQAGTIDLTLSEANRAKFHPKA